MARVVFRDLESFIGDQEMLAKGLRRRICFSVDMGWE